MAQTANYGLEKPSTDKNVDEEFYQLQETLDLLDSILAALQTAVNGKSAVGHSHAISDVVNLAAELAAKMPANQTFALGDLTDVDGADGAPNGYVLVKSSLGWLPSSALAALGPHGHLISEITGLVDALAGKADAATAVRVNAAQLFTLAQRGQARANIGAGILAGHRNKLINGDFDFWQRATSQTTDGYGSADRWRFSLGGGVGTLSRIEIAAGAFLNAPRFHAAIIITSPASTQPLLQQRIEGLRQFSGKTVTISFWAFSDAGDRQIDIRPFMVYGTGGSPTAFEAVAAQSQVIPSGVWTQVRKVFTLPTVVGKTFGTNLDDCLQVQLTTPIGATYTVRIAHVSLVEGDATAEDDPFSPRHPQQEEALCMRYYEKLQTGIYGAFSPSGNFNSANWVFKVRKRTTPAIAWVLAGANPSDFGVDGARAINTANNAPGILVGTSADAEL